MLSSDDVAELAAALCATAETLGQTLSASAAELMAEDLAEHPMQAIAGALKACRRELTGKLTLAAILQRVQSTDGRLERDEAWSIALTSADERETVVLTDEIAEAMSVARPVLDAGDKVGARMAFLAAYDRLVADARRAAVPARWSVSLGHDPELRARAIEQAVSLKRLPADEAKAWLNQLALDKPAEDGVAIAGLITGKVANASSQVSARLQVIRDDLAAKRREREVAQSEKVRRAAEQHARRVAEHLAAVGALSGEREDE